MKTLKIEKADNGYILHYEDTTDGENKTFIAPILKDATTLDEFRVARHPLQQFYIKMPFPVSKFDMIRKVQ